MAGTNGDTFVYETYVRGTPEHLWEAITDGAKTARYYYGSAVRSTWKVGDEVVYLTPDGSGHFTEGKVLDLEAKRRLVMESRFLWDPKFEKDRPHRETWAIDDMGGVCKLTVTFDRLEPDSGTALDTQQGVPLIVSSLKSFIETGEGLPMQG